MSGTYERITRNTSGHLATLRKQIPEVTRGFGALARAATTPGALDTRTKELIALGIAVAVRCDDCIGFHMQALVREGATREQVAEALGMAVYMGGGPSLMYAAHAMEAFEEFSPAEEVESA